MPALFDRDARTRARKQVPDSPAGVPLAARTRHKEGTEGTPLSTQRDTPRFRSMDTNRYHLTRGNRRYIIGYPRVGDNAAFEYCSL